MVRNFAGQNFRGLVLGKEFVKNFCDATITKPSHALWVKILQSEANP